jgi:hypothetical protein
MGAEVVIGACRGKRGPRPDTAVEMSAYRKCISSDRFPLSYSTRRDAVVTVAIEKEIRMDVNLMSIRSAGCRARIIVMVDKGHRFRGRVRRVIQWTGTEIFRFAWNRSYYRHTDLGRSIWLYEWLQSHRREVDRIFWFDAFDVFFQSDPFKSLVSPGKMTFISEGIPLARSPRNMKLKRNCYGREGALAVRDGLVLCFGTIGGDIESYLKFLRFMVGNRTQWFGCNLDQPQLNYYLHTGAIERAGIKYEIQGCGGTVLSMSFCPRGRNYFDHGGRKFFDMTNNGTATSAVVHHYKVNRGVVKNYKRRCIMKNR